MVQKTILIKKYENRRLYDATNSRYVNLDEVAQFLKNGHDVRVIDVATGADITRLILTQIIVEDAKTPDSDFPLDVLRQMVIASGRASQESALKYMNAMLDMYRNTYRAMSSPLSPLVDPIEFMQRGGSVRDVGNQTSVSAEEVKQQANNEQANGSGSEDVDGLKARVAELEKLVSRLAPKKPARKKTARKVPSRKK